jgi:hypothetical protein
MTHPTTTMFFSDILESRTGACRIWIMVGANEDSSLMIHAFSVKENDIYIEGSLEAAQRQNPSIDCFLVHLERLSA